MTKVHDQLEALHRLMDKGNKPFSISLFSLFFISFFRLTVSISFSQEMHWEKDIETMRTKFRFVI